MISREELGTFGLLEDVTDERLDELLADAEEVLLEPGDFLFREGDRAERFHLLVEGELETTHTVASDEVFLSRHGPGGFLSATALLTDTAYRASTRATATSRLVAVTPGAFRRLVAQEPRILQRLVRAIPTVMGALKSIERDREKLVALGGLAAGLAHELNNPAAAAARAADRLAELDGQLDALLSTLAPGVASVLAAAAEGAPASLDPLEASDKQEALADSLRAQGVVDPHVLAPALVSAGLEPAQLAALEPAAISLLAARLDSRRLLDELSESTARISALVASVKQYSHMDEAPRQELDVHDGIESTLAILAHKLERTRIQVVREFDRTLPRIDACGPELNQVWTNLIDNAIDALDGEGSISLRTRRHGDRLVVEVADDGPGIPESALGRIFDPFFTTKPPGKGTGIGLDISQAIAVKHHGEIRVETSPAGTTFGVVLPLTT